MSADVRRYVQDEQEQPEPAEAAAGSSKTSSRAVRSVLAAGSSQAGEAAAGRPLRSRLAQVTTAAGKIWRLHVCA